MTSEVCLMNSLSVVLAADSATTVEYYGNQGPERRYFKGANKIFQLSENHPVGLMIYHSASLLGVPWEVTIKEFRRELGEKSFNSVEGFAQEFIDFIQKNQNFFPDEIRRKAFIQSVIGQAVGWVFELRGEQGAESREPNEVIAELLSLETNFDDSGLTEQEVSLLWSECKATICDELEVLGEYLGNPEDEVCEQIGRKAFELQLTMHDQENGYTGLVFAGFGDHSVFPELVNVGRCKFLGTKFIVSDVRYDSVTHEIPAVLSAFAQTSMTDTFALGLSADVYSKLQEIFAEELKLLVDELPSAAEVEQAKLVELVRERLESSKTKLFSYTETDHSLPLRRVLGVLPVDEMADLAATLINLQSLKEKVTKPSETVGGPVDVAAITRAEGLVWIKRKHYFGSELNSRFFERRGK